MLEIVLLVVLAVVMAAVLLFVLGLWRLRRAGRTHTARIEALAPELTSQAVFFGQASRGRDQARGPGTLALTTTELVFLQVLPEREARIPRDAITSTSTTQHFLGKTVGRPLLVVTWDHLGAGDAAAFEVPDPASWRDAIG